MQVLEFLFCYCKETLWPNTNGEERFILLVLPGHSPSFREIQEGTQMGIIVLWERVMCEKQESWSHETLIWSF